MNRSIGIEIRNIPDQCPWDEFSQLLSNFGSVQHCEKGSVKQKFYSAVATYENPDQAQQARVQLNHYEIQPGVFLKVDFCMDLRSGRDRRPGLAGSRPYSNLGMPFRSNDFPSGSISGDALYNRSRFNSDLSLSESGDTSEESEAGDYAPEKKKKKMTVKSKREKRITPRRMLRSATERQNLARSARNDRAGSSDFSIVRRHQKLSENHILGSNQAAQSGFSFGSAATFAMPAGGFVLEDSKSEEESSQSYLISEDDGLHQEHDITYSPTDPNFQAKSEEESSQSYLISEDDGLHQEHDITYSPTDPNFQAKSEEESSQSYLISEDDGLHQEHDITYSPTDPNFQAKSEEESSQSYLISEDDGLHQEHDITYSPTDPNFQAKSEEESSQSYLISEDDGLHQEHDITYSPTDPNFQAKSEEESSQSYLISEDDGLHQEHDITYSPTDPNFQAKSEEESSQSYLISEDDGLHQEHDITYSPTDPNFQAKSEEESSESYLISEYDGLPQEHDITYSPTDPDYQAKSEEESSQSYLISEDDGLHQEHDITYSPTDPNFQAKSEEESSQSYLISEDDGLHQEHDITYSPTDPNFQGTGFDLPQAAVKALQLTAQAQSSPMSGKPSVSVATKCFMLSNMFDPVKETNPTWDEDIKNVVIKECRNHGGALHVHVDKNSPDGNVYVKCPSLTVAAATVRVLHGRYFAGRVINVTYIPEANYQMLFPDSAAAVAVL